MCYCNTSHVAYLTHIPYYFYAPTFGVSRADCTSSSFCATVGLTALSLWSLVDVLEWSIVEEDGKPLITEERLNDGFAARRTKWKGCILELDCLTLETSMQPMAFFGRRRSFIHPRTCTINQSIYEAICEVGFVLRGMRVLDSVEAKRKPDETWDPHEEENV